MLIAATPLAQQMMRNGDGMDWDGGASWWMVITMVVVVLLVVGVIVWAVVYASRSNRTPVAPTASVSSAPVMSGPSPRDLLDQRYARGEIDTAEYEERRAALQPGG